MTNKSKRLGTQWENECVSLLRACGWVNAERRALSGKLDKGDISGVLGVVIECKNHGTLDLPKWLRELKQEVENDNAATGAVWVKQRGKASAVDGYIVMSPMMYISLLREADY